MATISSNHVVLTLSSNGRKSWAVRKSNAARASRVFKTQEEAIAFGTITSKAQNIPLYVHNPNGTVARKILNTY